MQIGRIPTTSTIDNEFASLSKDLSLSIESLQKISTSNNIEEIGLESVLQNIKSIQSSIVSKLSDITSFIEKKYKTEYKAWARSNSRLIKKVEAMPYDNLKDISIDQPTGLKTSYVACMKELETIFTKVNIRTCLGSVLTNTMEVNVAIHNGKKNVDQVLNKAILAFDTTIPKEAASAFEKVNTMFDTTSLTMEVKPFEQHFKNMGELKSFRESVERADVAIASLKAVSKQIETMESQITAMVDYVVDDTNRGENDYVPTKQFVSKLAAHLSTISNTLTAYGNATLRLMAIEHNLVFVYQKLAGK